MIACLHYRPVNWTTGGRHDQGRQVVMHHRDVDRD
jgi:hypothetical protein